MVSADNNAILSPYYLEVILWGNKHITYGWTRRLLAPYGRCEGTGHPCCSAHLKSCEFT